ncbi:MAG: CHAD domain-containing protein [Frankiaceae bacterium]
MREVERKFKVHAGFEVPDLTGGVVERIEDGGTVTLLATYFDTPDLRLARAGVTLRRRTGGKDEGWHLKLPVEGRVGVREELSQPLTEDQTDVPGRFRDLVRAWVRFTDLHPAAVLETTRTIRTLHDPAGQALAEVVDDLVAVRNGEHVTARFREIEVEDRTGGDEILDAVADRLQSAGAVGGSFAPKAVRALGSSATAPPDPPLPGPVSESATARDLVASYLRRQVHQLLRHDPLLRLDAPDAVHQVRVASRRLRAALHVARPLLAPDSVEELRTELRWLAGEMSEARDAEVMLARLVDRAHALPPELLIGPVVALLQSEIGGGLSVGQVRAATTLDSERYLALLDDLVQVATEPPLLDAADGAAAKVAPKLVRREWRRLEESVEPVRRTDANEAYHRARIAAKRLRYACELVVPVCGKPASRMARLAEEVQELLGEHQDAVVAAAELRRIAVSRRGREVGFSLGLLHAAEQEAATGAKARFAELWPRVAKAENRAWLR